jgi:molecular chaperone DnaJ
MAEINDAWRVLSDPGRRAVYDASSRGSAAQRSQAASAQSSARTATATKVTMPTPVVSHVPAARFPWRFMLVLAGLGIAFILVNAALTKPGRPEMPDNLIDAGSCVSFADNGDAIEAVCSALDAGVVQSLIPVDSRCPQDTEGHRDRQGMGQVCVRLRNAGG